MRRFLVVLLLCGSLAPAFASDAVTGPPPPGEPATGRVLKVLPLLLDRQGHDAISPSLFDRDAYQAHLRLHTNEISAVRFDVLWKTSAPRNTKLKLRLELRGAGADGMPHQMTLEQSVTPGFFHRWSSLLLAGDDYRRFGTVVAWRATLWLDDRLIGEQKSFLW